MNLLDIIALLAVFWVRFLQAEERRLNDYIRHYEGLSYDTHVLHSRHIRSTQSLKNPHVSLDFQAHGRQFKLHMRRDTSTFAPDLEIERPDGTVEPFDVRHIYEGELWGEPGSHVHGSIIEGIFAGKISTNRGNYYIERADAHFSDHQPFHSIIYAERDVNDEPYKFKQESHESHCGNDDVHRWMEDVQSSATNREPVIETSQRKKRDTSNSRPLFASHMNHDYYPGHNMYAPLSRSKRTTSDDRKTCTLFLQSDTMLWERMTNPREEEGLGYPPDRAREEITSIFSTHVNGIKKIYEDTEFMTNDNRISYTGISFIVRRVKINETIVDCPQGENTPFNTFCNPNIDVSNFLNLNSLREHNDFCLAYVFTYRDFIGGTLGLAWVGSPSRASGGICEKYKEYQENGNHVYKSLNTGIITLINYNSPVPPKVSTLTFAHEVGHNFGSPHDSGDICTPFSATPSDQEGNYIMYASATSGDRPNNSKFSTCSKDNITLVLQAVFEEQYGKRNCFVERESTFCGNNIVEDGEECDCGYPGDCLDQCCYARNDESGNQCKRRPGKQCSPTEGPCCFTNCTYVPRNALECFQESDCNGNAQCDGGSSLCPTPNPKPNMTDCNENTQVCISGDCLGSICQKIQWEQCFLIAPENPNPEDKEKLCYVACQNPNAPNPSCISTGDVDSISKPENSDLATLLQNLQQESIKLPPGAPCNDLRGYCDVFQKCRDVDADGPLARLKKLLFNQQTFNEIRDWIIHYWWAVSLMGIGLIVFMGAFIKVCAVHTPSSNPKKRPARKLTLRPQPVNRHRPGSQSRYSRTPQAQTCALDDWGPPPAYSGPSRGGPPHGKGRGPSGAGAPQGRPPQYEMQQAL